MNKRSPDAAIFLDIDGVLAPQGRRNPHTLDAACVAQLRRVIAATGAQVILSSSWPLSEARAMLRPLGVTVARALGDERRTERGRPLEIVRWLAAHSETRRWVAIDDDPMLELVARMPDGDPARALLAEPERVIRTRCFFSELIGETDGAGLTEDVANRAIEVLSVDAQWPGFTIPADEVEAALGRWLTRATQAQVDE